MVRSDKETVVEGKIVIAFDICSSSDIIEDLSLTQNLKVMRHLVIALRNFLQRKSRTYRFEIYKFTGDGWILLFPESTAGKDLMHFLTELAVFVKGKLATLVVPFLEIVPEIMGITCGVERGPLLRMVMMNKTEYIGRALNIACRLQNAIKDNDPHPEYKVLVSRHVFRTLLRDLDEYKPKPAVRTLRNIRGGKKYRCVKLHLPVE